MINFINKLQEKNQQFSTIKTIVINVKYISFIKSIVINL